MGDMDRSSETGVNGDIMLFENENHHSAFMEVMKSMYDSEELVDVILCIDSQTFRCHRNVLAATSPYFRAMFTADLTEKHQKKINLYEVDPSSVNLVIIYSYTGQLEINKLNAQNLLAVAALFQISPIQRACAQFMETQLDITNCIGIYYFAQIHNCEELRLKAQEHIDKNFVEVSKGEEFMSLDVLHVVEMLQSNELNVETEELVYEAVMAWINNNREQHKQYLSVLLPHIRFGLMNSKYTYENVMQNEMIQSCDGCKQLLSNIRDFESNPELYSGKHSFSVVLRSGMIKPEHCILLIGGVDPNRPSINCYNPHTREAYYMADFQDVDHVSYFDVEDPACVVTDENQLFVAGGNYVYHESIGEPTSDEDSFEDFEEETVRNDFYQYDNDHDMWVPRAPMLFPKSNFALAYVDGKIYCFGGLTLNQHPTEIIERYDISKNRWTYVGMMPTTLVDLSTVVVNDIIYVLGGRTGVGAHNVVMRYDSKKTEWTSLAGMPTPRFNFGVAVVNDEIYIAGGQIYSHSSHTINREALSSVEIYNIENNQWRQGPNLPETMYNAGLVLVQNALYVCGTTEYHRSSYRIYRYNIVYRLEVGKSEWKQVEVDLCDIRDFACVSAKLHTRKLSQVFRPEVDT